MRSKPAVLPSSSTAGGGIAMTCASLMLPKNLLARPSTADTESSLFLRSSQSRSLMKSEAGVLARAREIEAVDGEHAFDGVLLLLEQVFLRLVEHCPGALLGSAGRRRHLSVSEARILGRQERRRDAREQQAHDQPRWRDTRASSGADASACRRGRARDAPCPRRTCG